MRGAGRVGRGGPLAGRGPGAGLGLLEPANPSIVYSDESAYYHIRVQVDPYRPDVREMFLDNLKHSEVDLARPLDHAYFYKRLYAEVMANVAPPRRRSGPS